MPAWADGQTDVNVYKRGDCATAMREWRPLAERGDTEAQVSLGCCLPTAKMGRRTMSKSVSGTKKLRHRETRRRSPTWGLCMAMERVFRKIISRPCDGFVWPQIKEMHQR